MSSFFPFSGISIFWLKQSLSLLLIFQDVKFCFNLLNSSFLHSDVWKNCSKEMGILVIIYASVFFPVEKARRPVRRHFTAHFDRDNVATRQVSLQNLYSRLVEMAEVIDLHVEGYSNFNYQIVSIIVNYCVIKEN